MKSLRWPSNVLIFYALSYHITLRTKDPQSLQKLNEHRPKNEKPNKSTSPVRTSFEVQNQIMVSGFGDNFKNGLQACQCEPPGPVL